MAGRVLLIALVCAVLALGAGWLFVQRSAPTAPIETSRAVDAPAPPPRPLPAPAPPRRVPPAAGAPSAPAAEPAPAAAAPVTGTLTVSSDVPGAQVFINREYVGRTPATAENLAPGTHRLNVEAEGFDGVARTIDITPGPQSIEVSLREVRLAAGLDVVHRHRIGSCRGRLTADPSGLRFAPVEGNDAFTASLADLETFEVRYAEGTLRVKVRGGREYSFTEPGKDADRLFVFHRDVDKARAQLAAGAPPAN